jgi:hypothetical protein
MTINQRRLNYLSIKNVTVLRYHTGVVPHWLFSRIAQQNNIGLECIAAFRINDMSDHWAIYVKPDVERTTYTSHPILNF